MKVGSTTGVISGLSPGAKKAGEDLLTTYVPDGTTDIIIVVVVVVVVSCHRFSFFPGTSLEPVVNPTTQASSLSL
jgi:hypothetical protein